MNEKLFLMKNVDPSTTAYEESAVKADEVSFYAEYRRDTENPSDLYGGDAYPTVWSTEANGKKCGIILVSDGLGSGSFTHSKLYEKYSSRDADESEKLYDFLCGLYGEEFFDDEEAVDYAIRSFSPRQPDSLYMTPSGKARCDVPFYARSSQYLASRIVCVGAFYKFRKETKKLAENWSAEAVSDLRTRLQAYIDGETDEDGRISYKGEPMTIANCDLWLDDPTAPDCLRKNVWKTFDVKNDPDSSRGTYLPCTFACWVFVEEGEKVNAAALYLGDSRCYKIDLVDGVEQISVDDVSANAEHDGAMTVIQTFGFDHNVRTVRQNGVDVRMHDGAIKATMISMRKPCAVFCCSDGVYDTCPVYDERLEGMKQRKPSEAIAEFELFREVNDLAFEYNFLTILRGCKSLDDVRQTIVRSFYAHAVPAGVDVRGARSAVSVFENETHSGGVKLDDSATLGIKFFSDKAGFPELITELRVTKTILDEIWEKFTAEETADNYCVNVNDSDYSSQKKRERIDAEIESKYGGKEFIDILVRNALDGYATIKANRTPDNKWLMYGIPNKAMKSDIAIANIIRKNFSALLVKAVDEFDDLCVENLGGDILCDPHAREKLAAKKTELKKLYEKVCADASDKEEREKALAECDGLRKAIGETIGDVEKSYSAIGELRELLGRAAEKLDGAEKTLESGDYAAAETPFIELAKIGDGLRNAIVAIGRFDSRVAVDKICSRLDGLLIKSENDDDSGIDPEVGKALEKIAGDGDFPFIAKVAGKILDGTYDKDKLEAWLNSDGSLYFFDGAIRNVSNSVICDDDTFFAFCRLAEEKCGDFSGFADYFGSLVGEDKINEIFDTLPEKENFLKYEKAVAAHENFERLSDDKTEIVLGSAGDYASIKENFGRKRP